MKLWKTLRTTCLSLLLSLSTVAGFGQAHYTTTVNYGLNTGNILNCSGSDNCQITTNSKSGGTVTLTKTATDLSTMIVYGLDASGNVWTLSTSNSVKPLWTPVTTMGSVLDITVSDGQVYALLSSPSCTTGKMLKKWGGASWVNMAPTKCILPGTLEASPDGTLVGINATNKIMSTTNPTSGTVTWTTFGVAGPWNRVSVVNSRFVFATIGSVVYKLDLLYGSSTAIAGAPAVQSLAATGDGYLFVVTTGRALEYYTFASTSPSWTTLNGSADSIFGSTVYGLFTLSGSVPSHFLALSMAATVAISGYFDCSIFVPSGQCPTGSFHTPKATAAFPHTFGGTKVVTGSGGAPAQYISASATVNSLLCDPLYGDPESSECLIYQANGLIDCSAMGTVVNQTGDGGSGLNYSSQEEVADTKFINEGLRAGGGCVGSGPGLVCSYNVSPICSNTANPDYKYPGGPPPDAWIRDYNFPAWNSKGGCIRVNFTVNGLTLKTPWMCQNLVIFTIGTSDTSPSNSCTNNP